MVSTAPHGAFSARHQTVKIPLCLLRLLWPTLSPLVPFVANPLPFMNFMFFMVQ